MLVMGLVNRSTSSGRAARSALQVGKFLSAVQGKEFIKKEAIMASPKLLPLPPPGPLGLRLAAGDSDTPAASHRSLVLGHSRRQSAALALPGSAAGAAAVVAVVAPSPSQSGRREPAPLPGTDSTQTAVVQRAPIGPMGSISSLTEGDWQPTRRNRSGGRARTPPPQSAPWRGGGSGPPGSGFGSPQPLPPRQSANNSGGGRNAHQEMPVSRSLSSFPLPSEDLRSARVESNAFASGTGLFRPARINNHAARDLQFLFPHQPKSPLPSPQPSPPPSMPTPPRPRSAPPMRWSAPVPGRSKTGEDDLAFLLRKDSPMVTKSPSQRNVGSLSVGGLGSRQSRRRLFGGAGGGGRPLSSKILLVSHQVPLGTAYPSPLPTARADLDTTADEDERATNALVGLLQEVLDVEDGSMQPTPAIPSRPELAPRPAPAYREKIEALKGLLERLKEKQRLERGQSRRWRHSPPVRLGAGGNPAPRHVGHQERSPGPAWTNAFTRSPGIVPITASPLKLPALALTARRPQSRVPVKRRNSPRDLAWRHPAFQYARQVQDPEDEVGVLEARCPASVPRPTSARPSSSAGRAEAGQVPHRRARLARPQPGSHPAGCQPSLPDTQQLEWRRNRAF